MQNPLSSLLLQTRPPNHLEPTTPVPSDRKETGVVNVEGGPRKPVQFTHTGRRTLKEAAVALETYPKEEVLVITLTHPGSTSDALDALELFSSDAVSRLLRYIRRHIHNARWMYCWEYQERGALHLHMILWVPPALSSHFTYSKLHEQWFNTLQAISKKAGVDLFASGDGGTWRYDSCPHIVTREPIKHSGTTYLAKLQTKEARTRADGTKSSPATWWDVSTALRKEITAQHLKMVFAAPTKQLAEDTIQETAQLIEADWRPYRHRITNEQLGLICWRVRADFSHVRTVLEVMANNSIANWANTGKHPYKVTFELYLNGECLLKRLPIITSKAAHSIIRPIT